MKKRTLCLLLAGTMTLSLLSGCGGNSAGENAEDPLNSSAAATENGGGNGGGNEEFDPPNPWDGEEEPTPAEDEDPFPRDPRWDELQPGETAVQFGDVFIKSGMTLGEAVDQINNSELFLTMLLTYDFSQPGKVSLPGRAASSNNIVYCDGEKVFEFYYAHILPGEAGDTFDQRDCPIWLVRPCNQAEDSRIRTRYGTANELKAMSAEDVQKLVDTVLAGQGAEVESSKTTRSGKNVIQYTIRNYRYDCLYDGYAIYESMKTDNPEDWEKGIPFYSSFYFVYETGELHSWSVDNVDIRNDGSDYKSFGSLKWGPENPGE